MKKLSHQEYLDYPLKQKDGTFIRLEDKFIVLGKYKNNRTKVELQCRKCSYIFNPKPNDTKNGKGCDKCGGTYPLTHEDYLNYPLKQKDGTYIRLEDMYDVLSEYINSKTPVKLKCREDNHIFYPIPNNTFKGHGCPKCYYKNNKGIYQNTLKYNKNKLKGIDGYLYMLLSENKNIIKIGASKDYKKRIKQLQRESDIFNNYEILNLISGALINMLELEKELLNKLQNNKFIFENKFSGHNECFNYNEDVKNIIKNIIF